MAKCAFCDYLDELSIYGKAKCLFKDCIVDIFSDVCEHFEDYRDIVCIMED